MGPLDLSPARGRPLPEEGVASAFVLAGSFEPIGQVSKPCGRSKQGHTPHGAVAEAARLSPGVDENAPRWKE